MEIIRDINNEDTPRRALNDVKAICLHHTGSKAKPSNILRFFKRKDYINVHYVVLSNGDIHHLVEENHAAWHAGVSSWKGLKSKGRSLNWCTIGIEVHSDGNVFTDAQRESTRLLIEDLIERYQLKPEMVLRHKDIAPKRKWDIGDNFWNNDFKTYKDYQDSYNKVMDKEQRKATKACIAVLSALWSKLDDQGKKIASAAAAKFKKIK